MIFVMTAVGLVVVVLVAWLIGSIASGQQDRMRGSAPDLRRAGDGQDSSYRDYGSPMG